MVFVNWQIGLSTLLLLLVGCDNSRPIRTKSSKRNITIELKDGDIAFRRGCGVASRIVRAADAQSDYTHSGVIVCVDGSWCVVHDVPYEGENIEDDKIYCQPIDEFYVSVNCSQGAIYRDTTLNNESRKAILEYLDRQLELQTPFDHDYDLEDESKLYCTELVWRAYLKAGIDLSEDRRTKVFLPGLSGDYIMPSDIEQNPRLVNVYQF